MRCARSIETTTRESEISFTVLVFGTSTSMPDCRIGAVIMKITSSTSITSTNGTMLISEREVPVWRASCGIFFKRVLRGLAYAEKIKKKKLLRQERGEARPRRFKLGLPFHLLSVFHVKKIASPFRLLPCSFSALPDTFFPRQP